MLNSENSSVTPTLWTTKIIVTQPVLKLDFQRSRSQRQGSDFLSREVEFKSTNVELLKYATQLLQDKKIICPTYFFYFNGNV